MAAQAELEKAEQLLAQAQGENVETRQEWWIVPTAIPRVKRPEFLDVLRRSRIKLRHDNWEDARTSAKELSEVGGVRDVLVVSMKVQHKANVMATFDNGTQTKSYNEREL